MQNVIPSACAAGARPPRGLPVLALLMIAASAGANAPAASPPALATAGGEALPGTHLVTLDTPVEDEHITSPFGWRVHPILKRRRFHKGVDFGAPEGTPVHAAEDGVIEAIGRRGHYGLYLRIRHCATVETAYAHLASFTPGLEVGSTVSRGQVIAEVGRTGWATGPHLYYEVIVNGHRINPNKPGLQVPVDLPVMQKPALQADAGGTS
ncbi:M23 family metallopeptidase [Nevskia soli]|uniref:M23 family metallopeptidase n=1 Tax=Nevskia soli TaxID=418856 RepID=UPI0004A75AD1|nr:M23 family metallopeptidase [Nevskia soli]